MLIISQTLSKVIDKYEEVSDDKPCCICIETTYKAMGVQ